MTAPVNDALTDAYNEFVVGLGMDHLDAFKAGAAWQAQQSDIETEIDAARYRWLRQQHWWKGPLAVVVNPKTTIKLGCDSPSLDRLDQMIDTFRTTKDDNDVNQTTPSN